MKPRIKPGVETGRSTGISGKGEETNKVWYGLRVDKHT